MVQGSLGVEQPHEGEVKAFPGRSPVRMLCDPRFRRSFIWRNLHPRTGIAHQPWPSPQAPRHPVHPARRGRVQQGGAADARQCRCRQTRRAPAAGQKGRCHPMARRVWGATPCNAVSRSAKLRQHQGRIAYGLGSNALPATRRTLPGAAARMQIADRIDAAKHSAKPSR